MSKIFPVISDVTFKPNQIVCLGFQDKCLYGEVIQTIEQRQTCWVRPILMVQQEDLVWDLRSSSDLILPLCLFRPCFDTEILPLFTQLNQLNSLASRESTCCDLNLFVREVWRMNQDKFSL
ncbi:hypothetical protein [Xenococcus sp. PCC 7305]|uniref:hypothetical protein n=1 Tax=Xenococcus sp. PCC 7305 TaxID=102125 RepID=UPI001181A9FD|nr:hypothetical protein [Xenococcus sp. PCC 7305]